MDRATFGDILFERRRELGYSIGQASRVLRLREEVLVAFEESDFERMPKSGYAQGMLSSYARYLGLDAVEVVQAYNDDLERYKRDMRRGRKHPSRQGDGQGSSHGSTPAYVPSRGLLPTSGGLAGDMGSFATTRVRTRGADSTSFGDYADAPKYPDYPVYPDRPYTGRTPLPSQRTRRSMGAAGYNSDIQTMYVDDFDDDLTVEREVRPYESASTDRGRRSSRNISDSRRPRVDRRGRSDSSRSRRGSSSGRRRRKQPQTIPQMLLYEASEHITVVVVVAVILILSLILVFTVGSCVRQEVDASHTVPVSSFSQTTKSTSDTSKDADGGDDTSSTGTSSSKGKSESTASQASEDPTEKSTGSSKSSSKPEETSVSVSVADGAVTWLEVTCDGKSDVAQTVTGPWQQTYDVEESITIQAGDTTAVSVVRDGRQVQFDSMASGIGSIRIQGPGKKSTKSTTKDTDAQDEEDTDAEDEDAQESDDDATSSKSEKTTTSSSSDGSTAHMGNASPTRTQGTDNEDQNTSSEDTYDSYQYGY